MEKNAEKECQVMVAGKVPARAKRAVVRAVKKGYAANESRYVSEAVVKKLREDGLLG